MFASGCRARSRCGDSGASAVEFAILAPIFLALVFGMIQGALFLYARNTAQSAAREGVSYLRLAGTNANPRAYESQAEELTTRYATELGRLKGASAQAEINETSGRVDVTVTGDVVLPLGGTIKVTHTSYATLEKFRGDVR